MRAWIVIVLFGTLCSSMVSRSEGSWIGDRESERKFCQALCKDQCGCRAFDCGEECLCECQDLKTASYVSCIAGAKKALFDKKDYDVVIQGPEGKNRVIRSAKKWGSSKLKPRSPEPADADPKDEKRTSFHHPPPLPPPPPPPQRPQRPPFPPQSDGQFRSPFPDPPRGPPQPPQGLPRPPPPPHFPPPHEGDPLVGMSLHERIEKHHKEQEKKKSEEPESEPEPLPEPQDPILESVHQDLKHEEEEGHHKPPQFPDFPKPPPPPRNPEDLWKRMEEMRARWEASRSTP